MMGDQQNQTFADFDLYPCRILHLQIHLPNFLIIGHLFHLAQWNIRWMLNVDKPHNHKDILDTSRFNLEWRQSNVPSCIHVFPLKCLIPYDALQHFELVRFYSNTVGFHFKIKISLFRAFFAPKLDIALMTPLSWSATPHVLISPRLNSLANLWKRVKGYLFLYCKAALSLWIQISLFMSSYLAVISRSTWSTKISSCLVPSLRW